MSYHATLVSDLVRRIAGVCDADLVTHSSTEAAEKLFQDIVSEPASPPVRGKSRPGRRAERRLRLAVAATLGLLLVGGATAGAYVAYQSYGPSSQNLRDVNRTIDPESIQVKRTIESPPGVKWTLVSYLSSDGRCLEAVGQVASGEQGRLGDCGPSDAALPYHMGGLELNGTWYNVAFGEATAPTVRVTLGSGKTVRDVPGNGVWIVAVAGDPTDPAHDFTRIAALHADGSVAAAVTPPSLAQLREEGRRSSSTD